MKKLTQLRLDAPVLLVLSILNLQISTAHAQAITTVTFQVNLDHQINGAIPTFFPPGDAVEVRGSFDGWVSGIPLVNVAGTTLYTNSYDVSSVSPGGTVEYKFHITGTADVWEDLPGYIYTNGGNRAFVLASSPQTLPPVYFNDQWDGSDDLTVQIDMGPQTLAGNFDPASDTVEIKGSWDDWSVGVALTNNPLSAASNIFSFTFPIGHPAPGGLAAYKFHTYGLHDRWESGPNRIMTVTNPATTLPEVFFENRNTNDLLLADTLVTFQVDMTNAASWSGFSPQINFDQNAMQVDLNGDWLGWWDWNYPPPNTLMLTNSPAGSSIYTTTLLLPKGAPVVLVYKYGIDDGIDNRDNEAAFLVNHDRRIRATGSYVLPLDRFGVMISEGDSSPPTNIDLSSSSLQENAPLGALVGALSATDPDAGDTATFTLASGPGSDDNGSFTISDGTNLVTAAVFDYEIKDSYSIRVRVTDSSGFVYEKPFAIAVINVDDAPTITLQPVSQVVGNSADLYFSVAASSPTPITYQWYFNGAAIDGATNDSLAILNATPTNAGNYQVEVSNPFGTVSSVSVNAVSYSVDWFKVAGGGGTSTNEEFTVSGTFGQHDAGGPMLGAGFSVVGGFWSPLAVQTAIPPVIGNPPVITNGPLELVTLTNVSLPVGLTGTPPIYYQWQKNGTNLSDAPGVSGATNSTLILSLSGGTYPGSYRLFAINPYGSVTSYVATISPYSAPHITGQPQDIIVNAGDFALFYAYATGNPAPIYQWNHLTNAYGQNYDFRAWYPGSAEVVVSNVFGTEVSRQASLTVTNMTPPSFTQQPQSITNTIGSTITFSAAANGNPLPDYEWRLNGTNIAPGGYGNATDYTVYTATNAGLYDVVASNLYGSETSSVAMLVLTNGYAPTFLTQPQSRTNGVGTIASFSVLVSAAPAPNYIWRFNGTPISYYGTNAYHFVATASGNIDVVVANYYGSITSSVASLTVTTPVNGAPDLITFDDLGVYIANQTGTDNAQGTLPIPAAYHGLTWNNFRPLNAVSYVGNPSGYGAGLLSVSNVAFNFAANPASISKTNAFDLVSGNFTAAWNDNLQLQVVGKAGGSVLYSNNYVLSAITPTLINFNYLGVTNVSFTASGGTAHTAYTPDPYATFALDNLSVRTSGGLYFITTPGSQGYTNRQFFLTLSGPAGSNAVISASTNLQNWIPLVTNPLTLGSLSYTDALATNFPLRFYRATLQP